MLKKMDIRIREMRKEDVDTVTALEESCFSMPWKRQDFEDILTNPDRYYLVAESDNAIVGGCMLTMIAGEGDVSNVAVYEEHRGKHIATVLMQELLRSGATSTPESGHPTWSRSFSLRELRESARA